MNTSSYTWGESRAADRVMSQVSGLRASKALSRLFMVMQAFIDESFGEDGTVIIGGYIASAETWANFSREWEKLLPYGVIDANGRHRFKMHEMTSPDGMKRVPAFFRIIEDHIFLSITAKINSNDLKSAIRRFFIPNGRPGGVKLKWGALENPYFLAFRTLMDKFHASRQEMSEHIPIDEKVDFYFDNRSEKRMILEMWDEYIAKRPESTKNLYGATPRFEDDMDFLPLQAADFLCWWARKWHIEGTPEKLPDLDFGYFKRNPDKKSMHIDIVFDEEAIADGLRKSIRSELPPIYPIYDLRPFSLAQSS